MSENAIYTIEYSSPTQENKVQPIAFREVWRYAGYKGVPSQEESELTKLLERSAEHVAVESHGAER